jgi:hypothetical protein
LFHLACTIPHNSLGHVSINWSSLMSQHREEAPALHAAAFLASLLFLNDALSKLPFNFFSSEASGRKRRAEPWQGTSSAAATKTECGERPRPSLRLRLVKTSRMLILHVPRKRLLILEPLVTHWANHPVNQLVILSAVRGVWQALRSNFLFQLLWCFRICPNSNKGS